MNYCEKCKNWIEGNICEHCGNKKLREVKDNDYCYFQDLSEFNSKMFDCALKNQNINDAVLIPVYNSLVTYSNAGHSDSRKIYLRFSDFDKAIDIYNDIFFGINTNEDSDVDFKDFQQFDDVYYKD